MALLRTQAAALLKHLFAPSPVRAVPPKWFLRRPSLIDARFRSTARIECIPDGPHQKIVVNGSAYFWPAHASVNALLTILSELEHPEHPNQYLWGPTQVAPADVVLDIGACEGSFALRVAERGARVLAVEPSRIMARAIEKLFDDRGLERPQIARCLLGEEPGVQHFLDSRQNPGNSKIVAAPVPGSYPVEVMTLDMLVEQTGLNRLDVIKCDAEGADVGILRSGQDTLERLHPKLAICTYHRDSDYMDLHAYLRKLGYSVQGKGFLNANGRYRVIMLHAHCSSVTNGS